MKTYLKIIFTIISVSFFIYVLTLLLPEKFNFFMKIINENYIILAVLSGLMVFVEIFICYKIFKLRHITNDEKIIGIASLIAFSAIAVPIYMFVFDKKFNEEEQNYRERKTYCKHLK